METFNQVKTHATRTDGGLKYCDSLGRTLVLHFAVNNYTYFASVDMRSLTVVAKKYLLLAGDMCSSNEQL